MRLAINEICDMLADMICDLTPIRTRTLICKAPKKQPVPNMELNKCKFHKINALQSFIYTILIKPVKRMILIQMRKIMPMPNSNQGKAIEILKNISETNILMFHENMYIEISWIGSLNMSL